MLVSVGSCLPKIFGINSEKVVDIFCLNQTLQIYGNLYLTYAKYSNNDNNR